MAFYRRRFYRRSYRPRYRGRRSYGNRSYMRRRSYGAYRRFGSMGARRTRSRYLLGGRRF
jgi:hypothetical protein